MEPAWPLLGAADVIALREVRALSNGPVRIDCCLSNDDVEAAVALRHALLVLERLAEGDGVKPTATRSLHRRFVDQMVDAFDWPGYEPETIRADCEGVNEPDVTPLHFLHLPLKEAKFTRRSGRGLKTAHRAKKLVRGACCWGSFSVQPSSASTWPTSTDCR